MLLQQQGYEVTYLAPDKTGHVTAEQVAQALREDTVLVSMMLVNNETGCIFPVQEVARLLREKNSRALLHCDAVQGFLKVPRDPVGWGGGPDEPVRPQDRRAQGRRRSVYRTGPAESAAPAARRRPGGGLRSGTEATAQIAALPGPWPCGRRI